MERIVLILSVVFMFASCSSNDEPTQNTNTGIVGYWKLSYVTPKEVLTDNEATTEKIKAYIIKNTGWWIQLIQFDTKGIFWEYETHKGQDYEYTKAYKIKGNTIEFSYENPYDGETTLTNEFSLSGDKLTMFYDETEEFQADYPKTNVKKVICAVVFDRR